MNMMSATGGRTSHHLAAGAADASFSISCALSRNTVLAFASASFDVTNPERVDGGLDKAGR